nr:NdhB [Ligusticopsis sp. RT-2022a]WGS94037.1 NdhB [Ligusticopsis sp. RT-2022a]WGS94178.1 NdhB [Ligusticopsis sp. RT-2022a]WGS94195.1 NdhB [Ligusticopsis sp. RT-2022a]WGS94263.1 NdhB [Ligusticopsis sp. RT-2022a]
MLPNLFKFQELGSNCPFNEHSQYYALKRTRTSTLLLTLLRLNCYLNKSKFCLGPSVDSISLLHVHGVLKNPNISEIDREVGMYRTNRTPSYTSGVH